MRFLWIGLLLLGGCDESLLTPDGGWPAPDFSDDIALGDFGPTGDNAASDGGDPCARKPAAADRDRFVVIAHPFAGAGVKSKDFEVLKLSAAGSAWAAAPAQSRAPSAFNPEQVQIAKFMQSVTRVT